jgi:hypothetical protein|tara:strand:- start:10569 stop:11276 length:708 start_codon:yes stop_codon:yes gene_type:complete
MIKKRVALFALSYLFAHNPEDKNIVWNNFIRLGVVSNAEINQNGLSSLYRIKRINDNTFRDLRIYAHFFESVSDIRIRSKSSNKYDFNSNLYHFTTYVYHKSGENLRYHFNQGIGALIKNKKEGNITSEIGWAYDKSDFIESDEKTTYLKSAITIDRNFSNFKTKAELEYYHQISEVFLFNLSRFETILEFQFLINENWSTVFGIDREVYTESSNRFRIDPITVYISINRKSLFN